MTSDIQFIRLLSWFSPSFPIGSYSYSHGIEFAVESGLVTDLPSLKSWIGHVIAHGSAFMDGVLIAETCHAVETGDDLRFLHVAERSAALRQTSELAVESTAQGAAFLEAIRGAWPIDGLDMWTSILKDGSIQVTFPIAVGLTAGLHHLDRASACLAYLHATTSNLVSAGLRLIPLGQTDGQRAIAALESTVIEIRDHLLATPFEDAGTAAPMVDWTSMQHETQYTRLFRS